MFRAGRRRKGGIFGVGKKWEKQVGKGLWKEIQEFWQCLYFNRSIRLDLTRLDWFGLDEVYLKKC